ncbi:MAG TPA: IucA/IucC family protein [Pseudonocardiaceae bacterium]|nr:IucA/IucC family protein [Pseudonocardiaceae bacterium]
MGAGTGAEQAALAALSSAHPQLADDFPAAVRRARAVTLGKLWVALSRERIDGLVPLASNGQAQILLPDGTRLCAPPAIADPFAEHSADLTVTLHAAVPKRIDHPVTLLTSVLAARAPARPSQADIDGWRQLAAELDDSVANHALALVGESWRRARLAVAAAPERNALRWAARQAAANPAFSPLALFERTVVDGHPLHPCARLRAGMSTQEQFRYAPEWADDVTVRIVAVARQSFTHPPSARCTTTGELRHWHPDAADAAAAHLRRIGHEPADYELLPVHPWQLHRALQDRYTDALNRERIIAIPHAGIPAHPLLSLRTLAPAANRRAAHLKTSVDIRLTTATRLVSPPTVHNGPIMSALLAQIWRHEGGFGGRLGRLVGLSELAGGSYRAAPGEPPEAAAGLAAIIRESPERHADDGEVALPVAALAARSPLTGRPVLAEALDELAPAHRCPSSDGGDTAMRFLAHYCDCTLPALVTLLSRWGVALEPHGQNAVVVLRAGLPIRLLYRDFGSVRVSPARLARSGVGPPALIGALCTDDEDELRAALFFPLLDTNLGQLVGTLARVGRAEPARLWRLVARRCRSIYADLTADAAIAAQAGRDEAALFGPTLPAKSMLRVHLSANPHAPQWVAVPNPLAAAG